MKTSFIERAINNWLEGYSVIPLIPYSTRPYAGFDHSPYEKRQPTIHELFRWSKDDKYKGAGVGIVVNYPKDRQKTLKTIRDMGDLDEIYDVPVFILAMLKEAMKNSTK